VDLGGLWDFAFVANTRPDDFDPAATPYTESMAVPACFDALPRHAGVRGLGVYRRVVRILEAGSYRLVLDGVHHYCRVFADGRAVGDHSGGFTRFALDLGTLSAGELELCIAVDNRFDRARSPLHLPHFDWYQFGGIARSVLLERVPPTWIERLRVVTSDVHTPELRVVIDYRCSLAPALTRLVISFDGQIVQTEDLELGAQSGRIERRLAVPGAKLWSPAEPHLHLVHVQLGADDLRERIGIRQVRAQGKRLSINGEPLRLLGVNRHQSAPLFGHALPQAIDVADVQLLRDLGANFVRGSHYPLGPSFLDLCDEYGICVWNEAIGWQHGRSDLGDPAFIAAQRRHIEEMVAMSENHPALIVWGILNEGASNDAACRPAYQELLGLLRALDPTRPVTYASMFPFDDVCFDLADIVAVNSYPGWYQGELTDVPAELERIVSHLEAAHPDKPLFVAEIGAEALPGWSDLFEGRWTEAYQARLLEIVIRYLFAEPERVSGLAVWQFSDTRTPNLGQGAQSRARGHNNKGIFDEHRRPKRAAAKLRELFAQLGGALPAPPR
jgi:beta-glucuronidase